MAATDTIGVAFLGVGRMGETHLRNIAGLHGVRVIAVADPRPEAAQRGKALANADAALTDVAQAITYPGVDAVIIVTPTETHAHLIETAVGAGKAVFSEKPIALDLGETSRVVRLIQEREAAASPGPEGALETLRLAVAATKSWKERRPVKVSEIQG